MPLFTNSYGEPFNGSAQESDEGCILGCFLENYKFGLGCGHPLGFQQ